MRSGGAGVFLSGLIKAVLRRLLTMGMWRCVLMGTAYIGRLRSSIMTPLFLQAPSS